MDTKYWILKEIRHDWFMSQREMADFLGVHPTTYSRYENGKRELPMRYAKKLAKALYIHWWSFYKE